MKKIGILTWHYFSNFGSALQAYALQTAIKKLGKDVQIINYCAPNSSSRKGKDDLRWCIGSVFGAFYHEGNSRFLYPAVRFRRKYMQLTNYCHSREMLAEVSAGFDAIVCGSDQIWAPNVFDPIYMLDFISAQDVKKVSYAASIGLRSIPEELCCRYHDFLLPFHAISVREEQGAALLAEKCSIAANVVLDPTFLPDRAEYDRLQRPLSDIKRPYVFCYFLNESNGYQDVVQAYAEKNGLEIVGFSRKTEDAQWMRMKSYLGPEEFLWLIDNAAAVFTDSYHGTIFSLLYHKEFFTFERFKKGDPVNQNSRIEQLNQWFGISDRILYEGKDLAQCEPMDYTRFEQRLAEERTHSLAYLKEALS